MGEREAVEKLISRMYKHHLKSTGKLPEGREVKDMESRAVSVAEKSERKEKAG